MVNLSCDNISVAPEVIRGKVVYVISSDVLVTETLKNSRFHSFKLS